MGGAEGAIKEAEEMFGDIPEHFLVAIKAVLKVWFYKIPKIFMEY
jgi:hypothetical protein